MKKPKPAAAPDANMSTWRGAIVTERQGNLQTVHRAAHVFVTPTWVCWIETAYSDPLAELRPSFHLRDGGAVWADGRFRTSTAADGREIDVVPFKPEEHQTSSDTFQSFNDWLASAGRTWQEERERMRARVNKAISRVKAKRPYAFYCWDAFWGESPTELEGFDERTQREEIEDEISALKHDLDAVVLPLARQVKAIAQGVCSDDLMDEMLSGSYSDSDLLSADALEAQIRILTIAVSAANRLLDEGCYDDARAAAQSARRVMQLSKGRFLALKAGRFAHGKRGTDAILASSEKAEDLLKLHAEPLSTKMTKWDAADDLETKIGTQIGMKADRIRWHLSRLFKGDKWPYRKRRSKKK